MLVSLCYVLLRWLLEFVVLRVRSEEFKELEIVVLRHELAVPRQAPWAKARSRRATRRRRFVSWTRR